MARRGNERTEPAQEIERGHYAADLILPPWLADPDAKLRGVLVSTLAQMAQHDSQSLVLLDWIATNDPSNEVRSQAQGALGRAS